MSDQLLGSIVDTARWVAYHRATESERADALFRDPFARQLAGERGKQIVADLKSDSNYVALRTYLFDCLTIQQLSTCPIDMVVNLAAGLDARPFRLALAKSLTWVETDLPEIIEIKEQALAGVRAKCNIERFSFDLGDVPTRRSIFGQLHTRSLCSLVISEGILMYLNEDRVTELAADLHAQTHFRYWLVEVAGLEVVEFVRQTLRQHLPFDENTLKFAPLNWRTFYADRGWKPLEFADLPETAARCGRLRQKFPFPNDLRALFRRAFRGTFPAWSAKRASTRECGVALLERI